MLPADTPPGTRVAAVRDLDLLFNGAVTPFAKAGEAFILDEIRRAEISISRCACVVPTHVVMVRGSSFLSCACHWRKLDLPSTLTSLLTDTPILETHEGPVRVDEPVNKRLAAWRRLAAWKQLADHVRRGPSGARPSPVRISTEEWRRLNQGFPKP